MTPRFEVEKNPLIHELVLSCHYKMKIKSPFFAYSSKELHKNQPNTANKMQISRGFLCFSCLSLAC